VGAVAVLFLFILMMLNIKLSELNESNTNFLPLSFLLWFYFLFVFINIIGTNLPLINVANKNNIYYLFDALNQAHASKFFFAGFVDLNSNIVSISKTLFNGYIYCFVLSGFALLLAMISAIILTLQKQFISRNQNVYRQILKNHDKSLVQYYAPGSSKDE
jgi:NADH:ubiquinone oxidoreductase subunit 6 (subunit J)